jgi:hypothetical protein
MRHIASQGLKLVIRKDGKQRGRLNGTRNDDGDDDTQSEGGSIAA